MSPISVFRKIEKFAAATVNKSAADSELIIIDWMAKGAVILHIDASSSSPKIKRLQHLEFDALLTESEKKNAFLQFLSIPGRKGLPRAIVTWSDGMTFRQLSIPEMPEEDLLKAFTWDLKKKYFFDLEDNLFGYKSAMNVEGAEGPEKLYDIFYCEKNTALARLNFVMSLGLDIIALVPSSVALAAYAAKYEPVPDKDILLCELQDGTARIFAAHAGMIMLSRSVSIGSADAPFTDDMLSRAAEEIQKTLDFYEGQKFSRPIAKVLFAGDGCSVGRLLDFMTPKMSVPIAVPDLNDLLSGNLDETDKQLAGSRPGLFAAAAGAAFTSDDTLNLVPDDIKTKNRKRKSQRWLNLGLIAFGFFLMLILGVTALNVQWMKGQLAALKGQYEEINARKENLQQMLAKSRIRRAARKGDIPVRALLKDLSLRTPSLVVLREVQYSRQDGTLTLVGEVDDKQRESMKVVTQFTASLGESVFLQSPEVTNTVHDEENKVFRFDIRCAVKGLS